MIHDHLDDPQKTGPRDERATASQGASGAVPHAGGASAPECKPSESIERGREHRCESRVRMGRTAAARRSSGRSCPAAGKPSAMARSRANRLHMPAGRAARDAAPAATSSRALGSIPPRSHRTGRGHHASQDRAMIGRLEPPARIAMDRVDVCGGSRALEAARDLRTTLLTRAR
jgi:hypothetical protein